MKEEVKVMKGMDNNAPHGFYRRWEDGYGQMMLMGGDGQHGYGGIPSGWEEQEEAFQGEWEDFRHQWRVYKQDFQGEWEGFQHQ